MADKDDILEEAENKDGKAADDAEQGKKGLSTALLIKIAIGLTVLLIVLAGALFFFSSAEPENTDENTDVTQTEQSNNSSDTADIDLPSTAGNADAKAETDTSMKASTAEKALSQMLELQQQISELEAENENLNKEVEDLTNENKELNKELQVFNQEMSSSDIPLEQLVNTPDLPRDYRRNDYANTPKFDLEPKWGEFETPTQTN